MGKSSASLDSAGVKKMKKVTRDGVVEFVETAIIQMKKPPPTGSPFLIGNNRNSIAASGRIWGKREQIGTGNVQGSLKEGRFRIFTQSGYGAYLELGTRRMKARVYIRTGVQHAAKSVSGNWELRFG